VTWTKTPDDYPDRLLELSDAAYRLHHAGTTYVNRVGLDGRIPRARLSLVPVPARTRRPSTITELEAAGLWIRDGDGWDLADFFGAQLSAEEVACRRDYDAIRQRIRFAKTPDLKAELRLEEDAAKRRLNDARERRRARASHRESHRDSQRPVPYPPRPDPSQGRGRGRLNGHDDHSHLLEEAEPKPGESPAIAGPHPDRRDVAALLERGWRRVTPAQLAVLDEIAARHDVAGHAYAAEIIRNTDPDSDPLEAVKAADRRYQDERRRQADLEEKASEAAKRQERAAAERLFAAPSGARAT
jgi:hypothetical protein